MAQHTEITTKKQPVYSGNTAILARRYANALFDLAQDSNKIELVASDLQKIRGWLQDSSELASIVHNPLIRQELLISALQEIADKAGLQKISSDFLKLLATNRRLSIFSAIVTAYEQRLAEKNNVHTAEVRSTTALSTEQQAEIVSCLSQIVNGKVVLSISVDPELLGGLVIKIGSRLIDASVKGKLARFERALKSHQEAA